MDASRCSVAADLQRPAAIDQLHVLGEQLEIPVFSDRTHKDPVERYGRVPRPWLGILSQRMTQHIQKYYNLATPEGVLVTELVQDGPSDKAGLHSGDIIVELDGSKIIESNDLEKVLAKHKPTEIAELKILRGAQTVAEAPSQASRTAAAGKLASGDHLNVREGRVPHGT